MKKTTNKSRVFAAISMTLCLVLSVSVLLLVSPIALDNSELFKNADSKHVDYDESGMLKQPFDIQHKEIFDSGLAEYDKTSALIKMPISFDGKLKEEFAKVCITSLEKVISTSDGVWYKANIKDGINVGDVVAQLRRNKSALMVDYNYISKPEVEGGFKEVEGNAKLGQQDYLKKSGIEDGWVWLKEKGVSSGGLPSVVVAVIDTGVDYNHIDLKANMWTNPNEIALNSKDDDNNGYSDDIHGVNVVDDSGDPMDDHGHGTHVAGIIAASNNKEGIVGIAYNVKIMAIKAGTASGYFSQANIAKAILYAYDNGADVVNMSFGGTGTSILVQDALTVAYTRCSLVASAGNDGVPNEFILGAPPSMPSYPAAYPYVLGVMSVSANGAESGFSNHDTHLYNSIEYEVYAHGESVLSTIPDNRYAAWSGTSMAAPMVSAMAALLRSYYTDREVYPNRFIMGQIASTTDDWALCIHKYEHNMPNIANLYDSLANIPKPDVNMMDYFAFDSAHISPLNNGDGMVDAGETLELGLFLKNRWGMSKDTVVTVDAKTPAGVDPYVTMLKGTVNYDRVGTYNTKDAGRIYDGVQFVGWQNPFKLKISQNCPNDYIIRLNVNITYKNGLDESDNTQYNALEAYILIYVRKGYVLPSIISSDMTLTPDNYYIIDKPTVIEPKATVTVEAGTQIQFYSSTATDAYAEIVPATLSVDGNLIVNGTADNMVKIFPSDNWYNFDIIIKQRGQGKVDFVYTEIANANLDINTMDRCKLTQYAPELYYVSWDNSKSKYVIDRRYDRDLYAETISNSIFENMISRLEYYGSNYNAYQLGIFADLVDNIFINSAVKIRLAYDRIIDGHYDYKSYQIEDNLFLSNFTHLDVVVSSEIYANDYHVYYANQNGSFYKFKNNAMLNNYASGNIDGMTKAVVEESSVRIGEIDFTQNYWGGADDEMINKLIRDYYDGSNTSKILYNPKIESAPQTLFPYVSDAYVLNSEGDRALTVGKEEVTFVVEFNIDMDTSVDLDFRFGASHPYAEYQVAGKFVSPRRWQGTYTINTIIENGNQFMTISNGCSAKDSWFALGMDRGRFVFEIDTTSAQAMIMQATPTDEGIYLTWLQDDFETLAGYNLYRSTAEDGFYTKLNSTVIDANTKEFFDSTVEPGVLYYYNFTVVQTDFSESIPSGKIVVMSLDTMAPNIYHSPVYQAFNNKNLVITASVVDNVALQSVMLYFRATGETAYKSVVMTNNNDKYSAIISAEQLNASGLEYYIEAFDGINYKRSGSMEKPHIITIKAGVDASALGDVDGDGEITILDALMLLQAINDKLNLNAEQFARADLDGNGVLEAWEALKIAQYVSGKITSVV